MMNRLFILLLALTLTTCCTEQGWGKIFTFDNPSELSQFAVTSDIGSQVGGVQSATDGIGGSGSLDATGDYPYVYLTNTDQSYQLSQVGDEVELWIMFRYKHPAQVSNGGGVHDLVASVGLASDPAGDPVFFPAHLRTSLQLRQSSPSSPIMTEVNVSSLQSGGGSGKVYPLSTLADDHWYRLQTKFSIVDDLTKPNLFEIGLFDFGLDGTTQGATLLDETYDGSNFSHIFMDTTAWAGFGFSQITEAGAEAVDNFAIVPEPSAAILFMLVLGAFVSRRELAR